MSLLPITIGWLFGNIFASNVTVADAQSFFHVYHQEIYRSDFEAVGRRYAQDAKMFPNNHPIVIGRSAIQAFMKEAFSSGASNITLKTNVVEVAYSGSFVVAWGHSATLINGKQLATNKVINVYRRQGNTMEILYDIWNSDLPLPK